MGRSGATENSYRYTGEYFDDTVALQYNRARWYDVSVGRFTAVDPANGKATQPLASNKYIYANGDPVDGRDPTGLYNLVDLEETEDVVAEMRTEATASFRQGLSQQGGRLMKQMGEMAERSVKDIIEGCLKPKKIITGRINGSKRTIDFLVTAERQVLRIEAKSRIPTKWGPALRRLKDQLLANKKGGHGLVTVIGVESEGSLALAVKYLTNAGLKEGLDFQLVQGLVQGAKWLGEIAEESCI